MNLVPSKLFVRLNENTSNTYTQELLKSFETDLKEILPDEDIVLSCETTLLEESDEKYFRDGVLTFCRILRQRKYSFRMQEMDTRWYEQSFKNEGAKLMIEIYIDM
jgi:hypothetical protein